MIGPLPPSIYEIWDLPDPDEEPEPTCVCDSQVLLRGHEDGCPEDGKNRKETRGY